MCKIKLISTLLKMNHEHKIDFSVHDKLPIHIMRRIHLNDILDIEENIFTCISRFIMRKLKIKCWYMSSKLFQRGMEQSSSAAKKMQNKSPVWNSIFTIWIQLVMSLHCLTSSWEPGSFWRWLRYMLAGVHSPLSSVMSLTQSAVFLCPDRSPISLSSALQRASLTYC